MEIRRAIAALVAVIALGGEAAAEIVVSPLRQVVSRSAPIAVYEISNPSDRILDARVSWVDLAATANGYEPATPALRANLSAAPYFAVSPSRFRLQPGGRVKVTVQLRKPAAVPVGERRSHLLIETTPVRTPLRRAGGGLEVDVRLGISTPVILRGGGLAAPAVSFGPTQLTRDENGLLQLETTLTRKGRYSSYGKIVAVMANNGVEKIASTIDNVAVHADAAERRLTLPLNLAALPAGVLTLEYRGEAEFAGKTFAQKRFEIAPPK